MGYNEAEINNFLETDMFYRKKCLNYKGKTNDTKKCFQEYIAEWLIEKYDNGKLNDILIGNRKMNEVETYIKLHNDRDNVDFRGNGDDDDYKRHEDNIAKRVVQQNCKFNDVIIKYYQIPVNRKDENIHGKVDLVGFNKSKNEMLLMELKDNDSEENLLRAIVEIYTYYLKIKKNIDNNNKKLSPDFFDYMEENDVNHIVPCVMFFRDFINEKGKHNKLECDYDEMMKTKNNLYKLSKKLGIRFFSIKDKTNRGVEQLKPKYENTDYEILCEKDFSKCDMNALIND